MHGCFFFLPSMCSFFPVVFLCVGIFLWLIFRMEVSWINCLHSYLDSSQENKKRKTRSNKIIYIFSAQGTWKIIKMMEPSKPSMWSLIILSFFFPCFNPSGSSAPCHQRRNQGRFPRLHWQIRGSKGGGKWNKRYNQMFSSNVFILIALPPFPFSRLLSLSARLLLTSPFPPLGPSFRTM